MTLVESTKEKLAPTVEPAAPVVARTARRPRRDASRAVVRTAVIALVAVIVGWAAFALFEGPIAQTWNRTRQRQLSAQLQQSVPHVGLGKAIAILQVPRRGINVVVAEGDSPQQLRSGPGHSFGTPQPGALGNSVVVGHRTGWGGAFKNATEIQKGDLIVVQTLPGPRDAVFEVISVQRLAANDLAPFGGSTDHRLTLVTGTGGEFSGGRLVVVAVSGAVGKATPPAAGVKGIAPAGSRLWNGDGLLALAGLLGGLVIGLVIRRRYRPAIVGAVVTPLLALGLIGLLLNLDLFLPPLR